MSRKVIIDCDPGIDDAVAICMALFDPRLEVVAITACPGNISAQQATRNVQAIVEQLDPPRFPRVGAASAQNSGTTLEARHLNGENGLGNLQFEVSQLQHQLPSEKLISDVVRATPNEVTIICLGPLTNIHTAFQRDPHLPEIVDQLIIMGGSVNGVGNVTPVAEFNCYADPAAAKSVFASRTTKTLIPLDVTRQLKLTLDFMKELPGADSRAGAFLAKILPFLYRSYHQRLGQESIYLHDAVALTAAVHPELFTMKSMEANVETQGHLTLGMTVFDRRPNQSQQANMEVAVDVEETAVRDAILRALLHAGETS